MGALHAYRQYEAVSELSDDESDAPLTDRADDHAPDSDLSEECKMVLGVRMDLKMDKGKIAAQCGHAALAAYKAAKRQRRDYVRTWQHLGQTKIAVKVPDEAELKQLEQRAREYGVPFSTIQDACADALASRLTCSGRTQVAPGSRTVIGLGPGSYERVCV